MSSDAGSAPLVHRFHPEPQPQQQVDVEFTPLYGTYDAHTSILCYLLSIKTRKRVSDSTGNQGEQEYDDITTILLDCGWDERFDEDIVKSLQEYVESHIDRNYV